MRHRRNGDDESVHFQRRAWVLDTVSWLAQTREQSVIVLAGTSGFGRRRFLDAVAAEALAQDGPGISVWTLDLEGYEPDAPDLTAYARFAIDRVHGVNSPSGRRAFEALASVLECAVPTFWSAALITLAVQHDDPSAALLEALGEDPVAWLCPPRRRDREALSRWLQWCASDGRVILHVTDRSRLTANQRRWLMAEAALDPRIVIAFACGPKESTRRVAPGARDDVLRLDDEPLTRDELGACLERRFHPNAFPPELLDGLHASTRGLPSAVAARVRDLLARGVIVRGGSARSATVHGATTDAPDESGTWRLRDESPADTPLADELERSLAADALDAIEEHADTAPHVANALVASTLCGRSVPIDLVLRALFEDDDLRARVTVILHRELVRTGAVFTDLHGSHPAFAGEDVWCLEPSLKRGALREAASGAGATFTRVELAERLVASFERLLRAPSRGAVEVLYTLSRHANDAERQIRYRRMLDWWVGTDEADDLVDELERAMGEGELAVEDVWTAADEACRAAPPARALALLSAVPRAPGGMPAELGARYWARRAHLHARTGDRERAVAAIDSSRQAAADAPNTGRLDLYVADLARLDGHLRGRAAASLHARTPRDARSFAPPARGDEAAG